MDDINSTPLSGVISGTIDYTSPKEKVFEIEVRTEDDAKFSVIIPDKYMHIVNRAIEYTGALIDMKARVNFDSHKLQIFVCNGLSIIMFYSSAERIGDDIA